MATQSPAVLPLAYQGAWSSKRYRVSRPDSILSYSFLPSWSCPCNRSWSDGSVWTGRHPCTRTRWLPVHTWTCPFTNGAFYHGNHHVGFLCRVFINTPLQGISAVTLFEESSCEFFIGYSEFSIPPLFTQQCKIQNYLDHSIRYGKKHPCHRLLGKPCLPYVRSVIWLLTKAEGFSDR